MSKKQPLFEINEALIKHIYFLELYFTHILLRYPKNVTLPELSNILIFVNDTSQNEGLICNKWAKRCLWTFTKNDTLTDLNWGSLYLLGSNKIVLSEKTDDIDNWVCPNLN